jgi:hypothetical protein
MIKCCYCKMNKERKQSKEHHMVCINDGENDFPSCKEMTLLHRTGKDKYETSLCEKYNFCFDSGATSKISSIKDGMVNLKPLKIAIKVGSAEDLYSEVIGTFKGIVAQNSYGPKRRTVVIL